MAQPFYYVGPAGGDFFDEGNWNDMPDGTGASPVGDPIIPSDVARIPLELIIDGDTVEAAGHVDFHDGGSLAILSGSTFSVTGTGSILDFNVSTSLTLVDADLIVDDDIVFDGTASFTGGSVTSLADDIEFQEGLTSLLIDGTTFDSFDNMILDLDDANSWSINGATFISADRLAVRNTSDSDLTATVTMTDVMIDVPGDVDDVFSTNDGNGAILTLLGASTLDANQVDDGISLVLGGTSVATLGTGAGAVDAVNGGTITLLTTEAMLELTNTASNDVGAAILDGRPGGVDYASDPTKWNVKNWNGSDPVTLQLVVPEPTALLLVLSALTAMVAVRPQS